MSDRMRRIMRRIADGLAVSAQAVAWRESLPWEPDEGRQTGEAGERISRP